MPNESKARNCFTPGIKIVEPNGLAAELPPPICTSTATPGPPVWHWTSLLNKLLKTCKPIGLYKEQQKGNDVRPSRALMACTLNTICLFYQNAHCLSTTCINTQTMQISLEPAQQPPIACLQKDSQHNGTGSLTSAPATQHMPQPHLSCFVCAAAQQMGRKCLQVDSTAAAILYAATTQQNQFACEQ